MNKSIKIAVLALCSLTIMGASAQDYRPQNYTSYVANAESSRIQDFRVDTNGLQTGQVIHFEVDGDEGAKASVKFNSSGQFWRTVNLRETQPGFYTGEYVVRPVDNLQGKSFSLDFLKGKQKYTAQYAPTITYTKKNFDLRDDKSDYRDNQKDFQMRNERPEQNYRPDYNRAPSYKNPDFGTVSNVSVSDIHPNDVNIGGSAIGAVLGGVLGHQVGGGDGRKAATVIGAIGGGLAGNQVGKNMNQQRLWTITVNFEDGSTQSYKFNQDPQLYSGSPVRREGNTLVHR